MSEGAAAAQPRPDLRAAGDRRRHRETARRGRGCRRAQGRGAEAEGKAAGRCDARAARSPQNLSLLPGETDLPFPLACPCLSLSFDLNRPFQQSESQSSSGKAPTPPPANPEVENKTEGATTSDGVVIGKCVLVTANVTRLPLFST